VVQRAAAQAQSRVAVEEPALRLRARERLAENRLIALAVKALTAVWVP